MRSSISQVGFLAHGAASLIIELSLLTAAQDCLAADEPAPAPAGPAGLIAAVGKGPLILKTVAIHDTFLDCTAATFMIPEGWHAEGVSIENPREINPNFFSATFSDPQNAVAVSIYPVLFQRDPYTEGRFGFTPKEGATADNAGAFIVRRPTTPSAYLIKYYLPSMKITTAQDGKTIDQQDLPEAAKLMEQNASRDVVPGTKYQCDRIRFEYERNGQTFQEDFYCTTVLPPQGPYVGGATWWGFDCVSFRAPKGQLEAAAPTLGAILGSRRNSIQWYNGVKAYQDMLIQTRNQKMQRDMEALRRRSREMAAQNAEISDRRRQAFKEHMESKSTQSRRFLQYIRDVNPHRNPFDGGEVEIPNHYSHAYVSNDGRVFATNDPSAEPPKDAKTEWRTMEPINDSHR